MQNIFLKKHYDAADDYIFTYNLYFRIYDYQIIVQRISEDL